MKVYRFPYTLHPSKDDAWLENEKHRNTKSELAREVLISYDMSVEGVVFKEFTQSHLIKTPYQLNSEQHIIRSLDFGGTNATLFGQKDEYGRFIIFKELVLSPSDTPSQAASVQSLSADYKTNRGFLDTCDPAGQYAHHSAPDIVDVNTCREFGIVPQFDRIIAIRDRLKEGVAIIQKKLSQRIMGVESLQIVEAGCPTLIDAFQSGFKWKTDKNNEPLDIVDEQHPYSDVIACLRYLLLQFGQVNPSNMKQEDSTWAPDFEFEV